MFDIGLQLLIDFDMATFIGSEPDVLKSQILDVAAASVGPQNDIRLKLLTTLEIEYGAVIVPLNPRELLIVANQNSNNFSRVLTRLTLIPKLRNMDAYSQPITPAP